MMLILPPAGAKATGNAEAGRKLAVVHCSRCHVIPDHNPLGGIGSTPSFRLLAELDDGIERFETFFSRRPHPSFVRVPDVAPPTELPSAPVVLELSAQDLEDIAAYARQLREWQQ